jgi:hypothetical protein
MGHGCGLVFERTSWLRGCSACVPLGGCKCLFIVQPHFWSSLTLCTWVEAFAILWNNVADWEKWDVCEFGFYASGHEAGVHFTKSFYPFYSFLCCTFLIKFVSRWQPTSLNHLVFLLAMCIQFFWSVLLLRPCQ